MNLKEWPRFPLAMDRNVPFLLVRNYALAGFPEPGLDYLKRCQAHGIFRTTPYPLPTSAEASAAIDDLISSPAWKNLNWADDQGAVDPDFLKHEIEFLRTQATRIN